MNVSELYRQKRQEELLLHNDKAMLRQNQKSGNEFINSFHMGGMLFNQLSETFQMNYLQHKEPLFIPLFFDQLADNGYGLIIDHQNEELILGEVDSTEYLPMGNMKINKASINQWELCYENLKNPFSPIVRYDLDESLMLSPFDAQDLFNELETCRQACVMPIFKFDIQHILNLYQEKRTKEFNESINKQKKERHHLFNKRSFEQSM